MKNLMFKAFAISFIGFSLAGCEASSDQVAAPVQQWTNQPIEKAVYLKKGMTEQETIAILGTPIVREFQERRSALQWCKTGMGDTQVPYDRFLLALFTDERLTETRNYSNNDYQQYGDCSTLYREVEWIEPVHNVIELRQRNLR